MKTVYQKLQLTIRYHHFLVRFVNKNMRLMGLRTFEHDLKFNGYNYKYHKMLEIFLLTG